MSVTRSNSPAKPTFMVAMLGILTAFVPAIARAQAPGQSVGLAQVYDNSIYAYTCDASQSGAAISATCPFTDVNGGFGTAATSSTNSLRAASASGTLTLTPTLTGVPISASAGAGASQSSALTVTGTPSAGDQLVFHFLTNQSAAGAGDEGAAYGYWQLYVAQTGIDSAEAYGYGYPDGTQSPVSFYNEGGASGASSASGFNFTLPFTPTGSAFDYDFSVNAEGYVYNLYDPFAAFSGSITATLEGIDAETAEGTPISSASFDAQGFGTINASPTTTAPEPSSLALLGTGLVGLVPLVRRRRA